jgi:hypothetical protein
MCIGRHVWYVLFLSDFSKNLIFSTDFGKKFFQISNSMKIPSAGAGRTGMHGEIDGRFSKVCGTRLKVLRQASLF